MLNILHEIISDTIVDIFKNGKYMLLKRGIYV